MYLQKNILKSAFILSLVLGCAHFIAVHFVWYENLLWFDIPMHILGGSVLAFSILFACLFSPAFFPLENHRRLFSFVVSGVLVIGVGWEIFEYYAGLTHIAFGSYQFDTVKDVFMDIFGASLSCAVFVSSQRNLSGLKQ